MGSMWKKLAGAAAVGVLGAALACTLKDQAKPDFVGPSELGLSLELTANPDVLRWDGASRSLITVVARNSMGQPQANVAATVEVMSVNPNDSTTRVFYDLGTISARSIVTGSDGRASLTYTAPLLSGESGEIPVWIVVTPSQGNAANQQPREVQIRLLPPGVILPPPDLKPDFTFTPAQPVAGQDVVFDATKSTGSIASYQWSFGDGATGTGQLVTHRYATEGAKSVTLTVTDTFGRSASTTKVVTVGASADPKAEFEYSPTAPQAGQTIYFTAAKSTAAPGRRIVSYDWDFGSGRTGSGMTVEKRYDTPGTYKVTLTVTDDAGKKGVTSKDVAVSSAGAMTADFTFSPTAPAIGQTVFFNAGSSTTPAGTTITSYTWDFGDGFTGTGMSSTHAFSAAGTYVVRLTITNSVGQTATTTKNVTVTTGGEVLKADFTFSPTNPTSGALVTFNANTSSPLPSIVRFDWDFGDGTVINNWQSVIIEHTYFNNTGSDITFTVRLTVHDSTGRTATTTKTITVKADGAPTAAFTVSPSPATVGAVVTFDGSASSAVAPTTIVRYEWLFGDGTPLVSTSAPTAATTHTYTSPGTYVIRLTVVDSTGRTGSTTRTLVVQ